MLCSIQSAVSNSSKQPVKVVVNILVCSSALGGSLLVDLLSVTRSRQSLLVRKMKWRSRRRSRVLKMALSSA